MRGVLEGVENMLRYASQGTAQLRRHLATGTSFVRQALWPYLELLLSLAKEATVDGADTVPRSLLEPLRGGLRALAIVTFRTVLFRETFRAHNPTQAILALPGAAEDATLLALLVKLNVNLDAFAAPLARDAPGVLPEARPSPVGRRRRGGAHCSGSPAPSRSPSLPSSPSSGEDGAAASSGDEVGGLAGGVSAPRRRRRTPRAARGTAERDECGGEGEGGRDAQPQHRETQGTHATAHDRTGSQLASHAVRAATARQGIVTKRERARLRRERRARVAERMVEGAGDTPPPRGPSRDPTSGSSDTPAGWNTEEEGGGGRWDAAADEDDAEADEDEEAMFPEVGQLRSAIRGLSDRRRARMHALLGQPPQDGVPVHRSCASYHRLAFAFSSFHFELDALAEGGSGRNPPSEGRVNAEAAAAPAAEEEKGDEAEEPTSHPRQARPPRARPSSGRRAPAAGAGAAVAVGGDFDDGEGSGASPHERWTAGLQALDRMATWTRPPGSSLSGRREEGKGGDDDIVLPHAKPRHFLPPLHGAPVPARRASSVQTPDPIDEVLLGRDPVLSQYSKGK